MGNQVSVSTIGPQYFFLCYLTLVGRVRDDGLVVVRTLCLHSHTGRLSPLMAPAGSSVPETHFFIRVIIGAEGYWQALVIGISDFISSI